MPGYNTLIRGVRRRSPVLIALAVYDIWSTLPPKQRRQVLILVRKYGPRVATQVAKSRTRKR